MTNNLEPRDNKPTTVPPPADPGLDHRYVPACIVVGLLITMAGGFVSLSRSDAKVMGALVLCSGLALVLAAFGSRAQVQYRAASAAGSLAGCMILFWLFMHYSPAPEFKKGQLYVNKTLVSSVDFGEHFYWRPVGTKNMEFIPKGGKFDDGLAVISITIYPNKSSSIINELEGAEEIELVANPKELNKLYFHDNNNIGWTLSNDLKNIIDINANKNVFSVRSDKDNSPEAIIKKQSQKAAFLPGEPWKFGQLVVGSAHAQDATDPISPLSADDVDNAIKALTSDDVGSRRSARDILTSANANTVVRPMLDAWQQAEPQDKYRLGLGSTYVLANKLRNDPAVRPTITSTISDADINQLSKAVTSNDVLTRHYATETLFNLQDHRAIAPLLSIAGDNSNPNGAYNAVVALVGIGRTLPEPQRTDLINKLNAAVPSEAEKTRALIGQISTLATP